MPFIAEKKKNRPSVAQWQKKLTDTFAVNGVIGVSVSAIKAHEVYYANHITENMRGHDFIMNAFFDFFTNTLREYPAFFQKNGWPDKKWYAFYMAKFISLFRSFKAADNLFYSGYPLEAFSLLRDIKDRVFTLACVANKYSSLESVEGLYAGTIRNHQEYKQKRKLIKKVRSDAISKLCDKDSGLTLETQEELNFWKEMFHIQVHGAGYSDVELWKNLKEGHLPLLSEPNNDNIAMYMCRSQEIAWMTLRLLPTLQILPNHFNHKWQNEWHVLDESLQYMVEELADDNKPIGNAIIELLNSKFLFSPETTFYKE